MHHLLALGFQGRYGAVSGGLKRVEAVRRHLFALLDSVRDDVSRAKNSQPEETPLTSRSVRASTNQGLAIASASLIAGLVLGFTTGVWTKAGDATGMAWRLEPIRAAGVALLDRPAPGL